MRNPLRLILLVLIMLTTVCAVREVRGQSGSVKDATSTKSETEQADELIPVAVPEPTPKALEYHRTGMWIWLFARFWEMLVPAVFLLSGMSSRLASFTKRVGRVWYFEVTLFAIASLAIVYIAEFPLHWYAGFSRQHAYGLSNQTFPKWMGDSLKVQMMETLGAVLLAWVPILLIKRRPRSWWWVLSILVVPYIAFMMLITPVFIDPLFNDFGSMRDKALESKILALADRAGIEGGRVYEVNKSVDTNAVNAYVTGLWTTKRIVLWDTLLKKLDDREILVVMGHEMGHYALNHVGRSVALSVLILFAGLFWVDRAGRWIVGRFGERLRLESLGQTSAIPLLMVLIFSARLFLSPVAMMYSRHIEGEADRFALELTHMNHSGARAFTDLQRENLGVPYRSTMETFFRASHPSSGERIEFCNTYHPWTEGKPLRYADYFKP